MSAQLVTLVDSRAKTGDRRHRRKNRRRGGTTSAIFGIFSIDVDNNAIVHHIDGSWFPNLVGTDQIRFFRLEGNRLILDGNTQWGKVHIVWEKVASPSRAR